MSNTQDRTEKFIDSLAALASRVAVEVLGVAPEAADLCGDEVAARVSEEHGGELFYITRRNQYAARKSEIVIYGEFLKLRRDYSATARACKVSTGHVYRVIKRTEAREVAERQGTLPLPE